MPRINLPGLGGGANLPTTQVQKPRPTVGSLHDRVSEGKRPVGDRLFVLIDISGSMAWKISDAADTNSRLDAAKKAFELFLKKSNASREQIGLVSFGSSAQIACEPTNIFIQLEVAASKLEISGSTAMAEGLFIPLTFPAVNRIILISDGVPDDPLAVDNAVLQAIEKKIPIDTIFIGSAGDNGALLMKQIAERTGGLYFTVDSLASFEKTFAMLETSARLQLMDQRGK